MKRLVLVVVLGAVVVASGCNASPTAATVNGVSISQSQLNTQLALATASANGSAPTPANQSVQCALDIQSDGSLPTVTGVGTDTVTAQFADTTLESLVLFSLEKQALARRHVSVSAADVSAARGDFESQLEQSEGQDGSPCSREGAQLTNGLPAAFLKEQAQTLAYQEKLEEIVGHVNVGPAALMAYYHSHAAGLTQVCLNLIVADTATAAQTIHDQIAGGASFQTASQDSEVDPETPTGGQVPCVYPAEVSNEFGTDLAGTIDALSSGQLAAPLTWMSQSSSGPPMTLYLVVKMRQHQLVPYADVSSAIREVLLAADTSTVGAALNRMADRASISIDPRYGTWSQAQGVRVPTPPPPAFVLNRTVNQAASSTSALGGLSGAG